MDLITPHIDQFKYPLFGAGVLLLLYSVFRNKKTQSLPPGPPSLPIIGNAHLIPKEKSYLAFSSWSKQYGID